MKFLWTLDTFLYMSAGICTVISFLSVVMASQMKSVDFDSSKGSVFVTTSPVPQLGEGEILIKVSKESNFSLAPPTACSDTGECSWCE